MQPNELCEAVWDVCFRLQAYALAPLRLQLKALSERADLRRVLTDRGADLFHGSLPASDRRGLCRSLAVLCIEHPDVRQWRIRAGREFLGWIDVRDISLLSHFKERGIEPSSDDVKEILTGGIESDFSVIAEPIIRISAEDFLRYVWGIGVSLEEGPQGALSAPQVAVTVDPQHKARIVGTWDQLFISAYDPFAQIHPAFTVAGTELAEKTRPIAAEFASRSLIGTNIISYWVIPQSGTLRYVVDDVRFGCYGRMIAQLAAEQATTTTFSEASMSMGDATYVYVQEKLEFPRFEPLEDVAAALEERGIPIGSRVFMRPDLTHHATVSLIAIAETPKALLELVYQIMLILADEIFACIWTVALPIWRYCYALHFLVSQMNAGSLRTTVHTSKVRPRQVVLWNKERLAEDVELHIETEVTSIQITPEANLAPPGKVKDITRRWSDV
jgi:hypothetical protein